MVDDYKQHGYKVIGTIKSVKGHCNEGHKVGETFELTHRSNNCLCSWLHYTVFPNVWMLQTGGNPWVDTENLDKGLLMRCPDIDNEVTIELKRTK